MLKCLILPPCWSVLPEGDRKQSPRENRCPQPVTMSFAFCLRILLLLAQSTFFTISDAQTNYTCPAYHNPCSVSCNETTNSNCPIVIDGTTSTYLNVNCNGNVCQNRIIKCPNSGCSINCIGDYSCRGTRVEYDGIYHGAISVNCIGTGYTCYDMTINAQYIDKITITCTSSSISYSYGTCSLTLNANFANNVSIYANEGYASYRNTWNVEWAKFVMLTVRGIQCI